MHSAQIIKTISVLTSLVFFPTLTVPKRIPQFAGPFRCVIKRVVNGSDLYPLSEEPKIWAKLFFTPARPTGLQYGWGQWFLGTAYDDEMRVEVRIAKRSNNQWKNNAFVMNFDTACQTMMLHSKWILDMMYGAGNYSPTCPLPAAGHIKVTNKSVHPVFPNFPIFPYGLWRYSTAIFKRNTLLGAVDAILESVPKL